MIDEAFQTRRDQSRRILQRSLCTECGLLSIGDLVLLNFTHTTARMTRRLPRFIPGLAAHTEGFLPPL
jgi:hypothetical protein